MQGREWQMTLVVRAPEAPGSEEALDILRERWEAGSRTLRDAETPDRAWWEELAERLGPDGAEFLAGFEAHVNEQAERWAEDRFRLGFVLGASGLLGALGD